MKPLSKKGHSIEISFSPLLILSLFLFIFCTLLAVGWLFQTPSQEELYGSGGRFIYELKSAFLAPGTFSWWNSNFLLGHSMASFFLCLFPISIGMLCTQLFGDPAGIKIASLAVIPLGSFSIFLFSRKLSRNDWIALLAALFYVLSASMLVRIANFEHWMGSYAYIFPPFILWGFLKVSEEGSLRSSSLLAIGWALMMLSYTKLAFMFLPLAGMFFLWLLIDQPERRITLIKGTFISLVLVFFLAVVLLLPLAREMQWVTGFHFVPFISWQHTYSLKNVISLLDRSSDLLAKMPPLFTADRGQFYGGIVLLTALSLVIWRTWKNALWLATREGILFRLFLGMTLFTLWLSHGVYSPLTGLLEFLRFANEVQPWIIPLLWLLTLLPALLITIILPQGKHHTFWTLLTIFIYFFIPGFLLLEKTPLFHDIRAPWGFWEVGFFALSVTGAIALYHLLTLLSRPFYRYLTILLLAIILIADSSSYLSKFFTSGLPEKTFSDFNSSQEYLKNSPIEGRVYSFCSRYFFLRTPMLSGRALSAESSWDHFQMQGVKKLLLSSAASSETFQTYMNVAGISHFLEDKQDPAMSPEVKNIEVFISQFYPKGFDSEFITIFENKDSLAPAFIARDYVAVDPDPSSPMPSILDVAKKFNTVPIELSTNDRNFPYLAGIASEKTGIQLFPKYASVKGAVFQKIPFATPRSSTSKMEFNLPASPQGWLVVTEAWHPDWTAMSKGKKLPVYRAFMGLIAVPLNNVEESVQLIFIPPFWYNWCLLIAGCSWILLLGSFLFFLLPVAPKQWLCLWTKEL